MRVFVHHLIQLVDALDPVVVDGAGYDSRHTKLIPNVRFLKVFIMSGVHAHITNIEQAVDRLYDLNVGVIGSGAERHERPHKPLLLLTVLDLIASGHATSELID